VACAHGLALAQVVVTRPTGVGQPPPGGRGYSMT